MRLQRNSIVIEAIERKVVRGEGPNAEERRRLSDISHQPGYASVDFEVYFDFDSAIITPQANRVLMPLGQAIGDGRLAGAKFLIAGHTDGQGTPDYNQRLSERRAQAIRQFLVSGFRLDSMKLIPVGYGMEELKNRRDPLAAENRRVQIVNLTR